MSVVELTCRRTDDLSPHELVALEAFLVVAFDGDFSADDWDHTRGGWHVLAVDGDLVGHAAVVPRAIEVGGRGWMAGYVESVGTLAARRHEGIGARVMGRVDELLRREFAVGFLSTGVHRFYERLGWERWAGPSFVREGGRLVRSEHDDDGIMVLRFGPSAGLDVALPISCPGRSGDDW